MSTDETRREIRSQVKALNELQKRYVGAGREGRRGPQLDHWNVRQSSRAVRPPHAPRTHPALPLSLSFHPPLPLAAW